MVGVLLAGIDVTVSGCGINFSLPTFHFPHVNDHGKLSYWEKVGEIDFGDGLILPVNLNFSADRHSVSPTLNARGFLLGLTDASAVQLDERKFRVYTPAGRYRTFRRDKKNPNVLHSGRNWKGEFKGDILSVASECGDRLTYHKGVITQMQLKDRTFDFVRSDGRVTEIREGGRTIVKVTTDALGGDVTLNYGVGKKINFQFSERPVIQVVGGQRVIGAKERTLGRVTGDNFVRDFEFSVDPKTRPTLKANSQELIWDTSTGVLLFDGVWKYNINFGDATSINRKITRINSKGEEEFWYYNSITAQEIKQGVNGYKTITSWFAKGSLAGRLREIRSIRKNRLIMNYKAYYNESGALIREERHLPDLERNASRLDVTTKFANILARILMRYSSLGSIDFEGNDLPHHKVEKGVRLLNWLGENRLTLQSDGQIPGRADIGSIEFNNSEFQDSITISEIDLNASHTLILQSWIDSTTIDSTAVGVSAISIEEKDSRGRLIGKYSYDLKRSKLTFQRCVETDDGRIFFSRRWVFEL